MPFDEHEGIDSRGRRILRLRDIVDYIKNDFHVSAGEILEHLNKSRKDHVSMRSMQHDLRLLRGLELIMLEDGKYRLKAGQRRLSKADHELSLTHSRKLLRPWKESFENRYFWLDLLVFEQLEVESFEPSDEMCLLQHLKSGYYRDTYERLLAYRGILNETGLSECNMLPVLGHSSDLMDIRKRLEGLSPFPSMENQEQAPALTVDDETLKKAMDLRDLLIGKLSSIEYSLQHDVPLKGRCDYCPHLEISIIE